MTLHESFWVVVGTAAPVLALANTVAIAQAMRTAAALGRYNPDRPTRRWRESMRGTRSRRRSVGLLEKSYLKAGAAYVVNCLLLCESLISLGEQHDDIPWLIGFVLVLLSLALLLAQLFDAVMADVRNPPTNQSVEAS